MNPTPKQKDVHWWSSPRTLLRTILVLDDTAHSIALGTAFGMFIALTPTVGIQMILVMLIAFLTRPFFTFDRMASLITVYISNPITLVPIYWLNYKVGALFIEGHVTRKELTRALRYNSFDEWWNAVETLFVNIGEPLIVGSLIVGTTCAALTYPVIRWLLRSAGSDTQSEQNTE